MQLCISVTTFYIPHLSRRLEVHHVQGLRNGDMVLHGERELAGGAHLGIWKAKDTKVTGAAGQLTGKGNWQGQQTCGKWKTRAGRWGIEAV